MRRTSRLVLLLGIFLAALVFVVIITLNLSPGGTGPGPAATLPPTSAATVVALQDIPLGTVITKEMLETQTISNAGRDKDALTDPSQAIGKKTFVSLKAGGQVHLSDITSGQATQLQVPVGMRAFAIYVNELTGVGNLVSVGDSVDVIISETVAVVQTNPDGSTSLVAGISNPLTVKLPLLLQDLKIIGTIEQPAAAAVCAAPPDACPPGAAPPATAAAAGAAPAPTLNGKNKLLILAVTPAQAEVLTFARTSGTLDVILRSPDDAGITQTTDGVILKTLIDKYGVLPPSVVLANIP